MDLLFCGAKRPEISVPFLNFVSSQDTGKIVKSVFWDNSNLGFHVCSESPMLILAHLATLFSGPKYLKSSE